MDHHQTIDRLGFICCKGANRFFLKYPIVFPWLFSTVVGVQQSNELWGGSMRRYHTVDLTSSFAESLFPRKANQTPCITRFRLAVPPWFQGPSCPRPGYPVTLVSRNSGSKFWFPKFSPSSNWGTFLILWGFENIR